MLAAYSGSELVAEAPEEARSRMPAMAARLKEPLAALEADIRRTDEALERYFLTFEAGTMSELACSGRIERLTAHLANLHCDRVGLQNAIDLDDRMPTSDEFEEFLAEIREMINSGTREDHNTLTSVLVGPR